MNTKTCTKCHQVLTLDRFSLCRGKPGSWCKECIAAYTRDYSAKNPENKRTYQLKYVAKNREKVNAYWRDYCAKNPEKKRTYKLKYAAKNREKLRAYRREYYVKNSEKLKANQRDYRAKNRETLNAKMRDRYHGKIVSKRTVNFFQTVLLSGQFK